MIVAVDHEYISENPVRGERPDVRNVYCEIMQVGACKLSVTGEEVGTLNITVLPTRIEHIPQWLQDMTGMTEEIRSKGVSFAEALENLYDFSDGVTPWTFNGDWWVLEGNVAANGLKMPFVEPFYRLKPLLSDAGVTLADYQKYGFQEVNSGNLHKVLGVVLPQIEGVGAHDAAHDARSLAYSVFALKKAGKI